MTSVLDQQVSGQASPMGSKGDGGGEPPHKKPSDVGREYQEEASEDYIPLEYHVGEDETCPDCGKHKGPHRQLERCKICKKQHLGTCDRACKICGSGKHPTKYHPNRAESSTDDAANFARFVSAGLTSAWNNRYGGVTKPGQGRGQGRGRGHGQRGGQNRGSDRGQGRAQRGGRGRGRGFPDPKAKGQDGDNRPAPK